MQPPGSEFNDAVAAVDQVVLSLETKQPLNAFEVVRGNSPAAATLATGQIAQPSIEPAHLRSCRETLERRRGHHILDHIEASDAAIPAGTARRSIASL